MTWLVSILARWGVPEGLRKPLAWAGAILAALALLAVLKGCYDRSVIDRHEAKVERKAADATNKAAEERATDTIRNTANEKEMHDAIDAAPKGGTLSPAAHALACERLCKRGNPPASCRPCRSDGGQADPR